MTGLHQVMLHTSIPTAPEGLQVEASSFALMTTSCDMLVPDSPRHRSQPSMEVQMDSHDYSQVCQQNVYQATTQLQLQRSKDYSLNMACIVVGPIPSQDMIDYSV